MSEKLNNAQNLYKEVYRMEKLRKSYPAIWEKVILNLQNLNDGSIKWITMDIFRADNDGRIVEHWDNREIVPSREELTNSGKF